MSIAPGTRLGPYEITGALGAGGMGEVYAATDTRLDRTVALKVLPAELAVDRERRDRFEREAKAIAALNHPHICTLHDVGHEAGTDFLVMERLEGESLQDRLARGPLPLDDALEIAIQVADALDKAHRQGITHRDLKPGNVFLVGKGAARRGSSRATRQGSPQAKLLDFGLAKLTDPSPVRGAGLPGPEPSRGQSRVQPSQGQSPDDDQPTKLADSLTAEGTILGTFHYMAPEQLEGREADARSDIWAFGCLVYEMVTGARAFAGETQAGVIAAILEREPTPIDDLQPVAPAGLSRIVTKALAKSHDRRWQSAGDMGDALRWLAEPSAEKTTPVERVTSFRPTSAIGRFAWAAGIFVAGGLAMFLASRVAAPVPRAVSNASLTHTVVSMPPNQQLIGSLLGAAPFAVSSDGRGLAYTVSEGTTTYLYLQRFDEFGARRVPQSEGANSPFFSPDGQWVGFFARDGLYKVSTAGGGPSRISDGPAIGWGAHWTSDDAIIYSNLFSLLRVPAAGGTPDVLYRVDADLTVRWPTGLPGGDDLLVAIGPAAGLQTSVARLALDTGEVSAVPGLNGAVMAVYMSPAYLIYTTASGELWAGAFDLTTDDFIGSPVPLLDDVEDAQFAGTLAAVGSGGTLVYAPQGAPSRLAWVDRNGDIDPIGVEPGRYRVPRLDPDGGRAVVTATPRRGDVEIRLIDLARGGNTRLATGNFPVWMPDGATVTAAIAQHLSLIPIGRPSSVTPVEGLEGNDPIVPGSWSADGRLLVVYRINADTNRDIWVVSRDGGAEPFLVTPANERTPFFSPDGNWVVYVSDESGRDEVYVQEYPSRGQRWVVSTDGGTAPVWSADGTEIFYRNGQQMLVVEVTPGETFEHGSPRILFEARFGVDPSGLPNYDVTPDGQRFLMLTDSSPTELRVIANFGEMVAERLASEP